ncbi:hypothetical protein BT69DRAFT_1348859 [Atractiella rhizophila]|nr:hypothetical protein BT69DRAFT_1348859 [Atractiella rhizophila]
MSKWASLPDIDLGQDIYETADIPDEQARTRDSDSESELVQPSFTPAAARNVENGTEGTIERTKIDVRSSRKLFDDRDVSPLPSTSTYTLHPRTRPGYSSSRDSRRSPLKEDEAEPETTFDKFRRLRLELEELEIDLKREEAAQKSAADEESTTEEEEDRDVVNARVKRRKGKGVPAERLLKEIKGMRGNLNRMEEKFEGSGEGDDEALSKQHQLLGRQLLSQLYAPTKKENGVIAEGEHGKDMKLKVPVMDVGKLEERLQELERFIGANEAEVDESHPLPPPLLSTLARLDHLLTLLTQPRHLDSISRRVKVLVSDLERLHESRKRLGDTRPINIALPSGITVVSSGDAREGAAPPTNPNTNGAAVNIPPDTLAKIDTLFALQPRLEPLLPLVPRLLTRLRSLATLHQSASAFSQMVGSLKEEAERLGESEKGVREVLGVLEGSLRENEERIKGNLEALEGRVEEVGRRLEETRKRRDGR